MVNVGALLWNISVLRKYRVGYGTVISIFLLIALVGATISAFAGVEPLSSVKDEIVDFFRGSDIEAHISTEVSSSSGYYNVPVELVPSDSVELDCIYCVQLNSSEGYSFGRSLVYWTPDNSRTIKTVNFIIPAGDKVASKIESLDQEVLMKWFYGEDFVSTKKWYEANLNKILKVKIISNIELVMEASLYTETLAIGDYNVFAKLIPSSFVEAGEIYSVQLWYKLAEVEEEYYRVRSISFGWTKEELDAKEPKIVPLGKIAKDFWESRTFIIKVLPD